MKTKEEIINDLLNGLTWESYPILVSGGQSCGISTRGCTLICPETSFKLSVCEYRSQLKNKELAIELYKIYLEKIINVE